MKASTLNKAITIISVIILIILWYFLAKYINAPLILPFPSGVFATVINFFCQKKFLIAVIFTARRCLIAFLISFIAGLLIGTISASSLKFRTFFEIPLSLIRSTPVISIILLALFWLKSDQVPIFAAILMSLPIMITCVQTGFSLNDKKLLHMAKTYNLSKSQILFFIRIPSAYPSITAGTKSCAGMIWKVVAAGEVISLPRNAIGTYLQNAQIILETEQVFAITAIIVTLSFICTISINMLIAISGKLGMVFTKWYFKQNIYQIKNKKEPYFYQEPQEIHIKGINLGYDKLIFKGFSLDIEKSEILGILAPSGCGKTTLLNYIADTNTSTSYIFQEPRLIANLTVLQNIMIPLINLMPQNKALEYAKIYIEKAGLKAKENSYPSELSGGEKQRVSLARAFAYPSGIILMDEPFQSQDFISKNNLINIFKTLQNDQKRTTVLVTHQPSEALNLADRIIFLYGQPVKIIFNIKNH